MKTNIPEPLAAALKRLAPSVIFSVSAEIDPCYRWDGDGPDPVENGFDAYDITVKALTIDCGTIREGEAYLGGSYFEPDEPTGEIHGYLLQMLEEAAEELQKELARWINKSVFVNEQLAAVRSHLKAAMQTAYDEQRATAANGN